MKSVLICVPTHHGESPLFRAGYGDLLFNQIPGWEFSWLEVGGCGITHARDMGAAKCIREGFDVLLFLASDIGFNAMQIKTLLQHFDRDPDVGVVGGLYLLKRVPFRLCLNEKLGEQVYDAETGLWEIHECGTDIMAISRSVLEKIIAAHPEIEYEDYVDLEQDQSSRGKSWNIFNMGVVEERGKRRFLTEDFWFCRLARSVGCQIFVDTRIKVKHDGHYVFDAEAVLARNPLPVTKPKP